MVQLRNQRNKIASQDCKRIFILRPDHLGDLILYLPSLRRLRDHFADAEITLCIKSYVRNLLELSELADHLVTWESIMDTPLNSLPEVKGKYRLNSLLRKGRIRKLSRNYGPFDLYLLPLRSIEEEYHWFSGQLEASRKISIDAEPYGLEDSRKRAIDNFYTDRLHISEGRSFEHEMIINSEFLDYLGIESNREPDFPEIHTSDEDRRWATETLIHAGDTLLIGIAPGVSVESGKFYSADHYHDLFKTLSDHSFSVILFGSTAETGQCREVETALTGLKCIKSLQNVCGKSTLRQLAESFKRCDIILSNETGALHLATALQKPTVGIVGGGHFERFYPWGDPDINRLAHKPMDCFYCRWDCIYPEKKCIHDINPSHIAREMETLITQLTRNKTDDHN